VDFFTPNNFNPSDFSGNDLQKLAGEKLAPMAVALIEEYLGRKIMQATYTEYYSGTGRPFFALRQRPVQSISALYLDEEAFWGDAPGAFNPTTTQLIEGTDFALDRDQPDGSSRSGLVYKINDYWPRPIVRAFGRIAPDLGPRVGNIIVSYTAGYQTLPNDLGLAVSLTMAHLLQLGRRGGVVQSESHGEGFNYQFSVKVAEASAADILPPYVKRILARYRNVAVG